MWGFVALTTRHPLSSKVGTNLKITLFGTDHAEKSRCRWRSVFTAQLHSKGSYSIVACIFVATEMCLPSCCLAMNVYSVFTIPAFGRHVTLSLGNNKKRTGIYKTIILPVVLYGCETWSLTLREEHRLRVFENKVLRMWDVYIGRDNHFYSLCIAVYCRCAEDTDEPWFEG
jgi:hypothetical protein